MIQWNAALSRRLACPVSKKAALPGLIRSLTAYARKARVEGIQTLSEEAKASSDPFLQVGLSLVAEGLSDEILEDILATYLVTSADEGFDFLRQCMVAETLVSIAQGDHPSLTERKLVAYCGAEVAAGLLSELDSLHRPFGSGS
jgi:flagellar motor component MotA